MLSFSKIGIRRRDSNPYNREKCFPVIRVIIPYSVILENARSMGVSDVPSIGSRTSQPKFQAKFARIPCIFPC